MSAKTIAFFAAGVALIIGAALAFPEASVKVAAGLALIGAGGWLIGLAQKERFVPKTRRMRATDPQPEKTP